MNKLITYISIACFCLIGNSFAAPIQHVGERIVPHAPVVSYKEHKHMGQRPIEHRHCHKCCHPKCHYPKHGNKHRHHGSPTYNRLQFLLPRIKFIR